jgi:hypothetical protein
MAIPFADRSNRNSCGRSWNAARCAMRPARKASVATVSAARAPARLSMFCTISWKSAQPKSGLSYDTGVMSITSGGSQDPLMRCSFCNLSTRITRRTYNQYEKMKLFSSCQFYRLGPAATHTSDSLEYAQTDFVRNGAAAYENALENEGLLHHPSVGLPGPTLFSLRSLNRLVIG